MSEINNISSTLLPIEDFPPFLQEFITTCSETYGTPRDYWAGAVLVATALGIGDKIELVDKYVDVPIIWLCNVGDVAIGKTEPLKICLEYFQKKDSASIKVFNEAQEALELAIKSGKEKPGLERPKCTQYVVVDSTPEALAEVHSVNNRGLLIYRDEIKGWIDDFGRYSKSGEQSNMLSTFNRVPMTINRKGDGKITNIGKPLILVAGGMQPDLLKDFARDNRAESGFLARFVFTYPDNATRGGYVDRTLPEGMQQAFENYLDQLVNLSDVYKVVLSKEAKKAFIDWYNANDEIINAESSTYIRGSFGKLPIVCSRIAVIIRGMWMMFSEEDLEDSLTVQEMQTAIAITEYFRTTALKVYERIFLKEPQSLPEKKDVARFLFEKTDQNKTNISKILKVDRKQVYRWLE
jgi:hypothetical protein